VSGQVQKPKPERKVETPEQEPAKAKSGEELKAELDAVLDDIEEVLEENAEAMGMDEVLDGIDAEIDMDSARDMVASFVQKGGEARDTPGLGILPGCRPGTVPSVELKSRRLVGVGRISRLAEGVRKLGTDIWAGICHIPVSSRPALPAVLSLGSR
jgi:ubiquitin-like protein Pup